jgi:hypothetical protein
VIAGTGKLGKLLSEHGKSIEERLGEDVVNTVINAPEQLQAFDSSQSDVQGDKSATFLAQRQLREDAAGFVADRCKVISIFLREDKAAKRDFGIGRSMNVTSPNTIHKALTSFISASEAAPAKVTAAGITPAEIARMKELAAQIVTGRKLQAGSVAAAKSATVARNLLQIKVENAMIKVVATAALVYRDTRPELVELFEATLPKSRGGSRKKKPASKPETEKVG